MSELLKYLEDRRAVVPIIADRMGEYQALHPTRGDAFIGSDWFEVQPTAAEVYERRAIEWMKNYEPRVSLPSVSDLIREVWGAQSLSNQFYEAKMAFMERPDADLDGFAVSLRRSQARRQETRRDRVKARLSRLAEKLSIERKLDYVSYDEFDD